MQRPLFNLSSVVYYDPAKRNAPENLKDYLDSKHIGLTFLQSFKGGLDDVLKSQGHPRQVAVSVPNFSSVASYLRETDMLTTLPPLMSLTEMRNFASTSLPFNFSAGKMHLFWHRSFQEDARHKWLRKEMLNVVNSLPEK